MLKRILCTLLALFLLIPVAAFTEAQESAVPPEGDPAPFGVPAEGDPASSGMPGEEDSASSGQPMSGMPTGMEGLDSEIFEMDDIPADYLQPCDQEGRVEKVTYVFGEEEDGSLNAAMVYLPVGYDESEEKYNVLYLLHASGGKPTIYLNPEKKTKFRNLLDHMIADGRLEPLIVVAATYYPPESSVQYMFLGEQVELVSMFPMELVNKIIPTVEQNYRTYAETTDLEGIVASRAHRGIAGFSLGGVATWNVFRMQMQCFRWFLPISEASWTDEEGGTSGIWDSDVSAKVLYDAVLEQGYGKDDFRLFVATGTEDEAFDISTKQMMSLLEYGDMFKPGDNTSCSMMGGGTHTTQAVYTYLYHILPALFRD